ncbi:MAG: sterol desaturase family protein [Betaproteobacteria bacterium]|jgi:alkylglycerol monooxygenase
MTGAQIIVLATPVFLLLIALEFAVGLARGRNTYRLADTLTSIGLGVMSQVTGVFGRLLRIGIYVLLFEQVALLKLPVDSPWVWLGALLAYDLCYYWHHRAAHRVAVFWAAHVVHHQSEDYNLGTALRQTSSGFLLGWVFYLPLALAGVPPVVFATVALIDLLYQFWVHTQQVGRLGWFDRWFVSPSNHRVHHAVNGRYLDRNYGGILVVWDRLFGSFAEEDDAEPIVYGTRAPLRRWCPLAANLDVYRDLWADSRRTRRWADKLRLWFMPPGWRPADVAAQFPRPAFDIAQVRRFETAVPRRVQGLAAGLFLLVLGATSGFLWFAHAMPAPQRAAGAVALVGALWLIGRLLERGADAQAAGAAVLVADGTVPDAPSAAGRASR